MAKPAQPRGAAKAAPRKPAAANTPAKAASAAPPQPNRERPNEPVRYKADKAELLEFYRQMMLIRRFEEKAGQLYGLGLIGGFCHLYIGQEAVAVGLQSALTVGQDSVITGYRDHGHMLAYGIDPKLIMAELTGRAAGISRGKGGSMHMFSVEHRFYGGHGIVGAQVSLGTGLALKHKSSGDGGIAMAYFGDGNRWVAGEHAVVEGRLNALVNRLNVFARNASTRDVIDKLVTATDARRLEVNLDNCELPRTTRLLDVSVLNCLNFFGHCLTVCNLWLTNSCINTKFALHAVDKNFQVQLTHSRNYGLSSFLVGANTERWVFVRQ